MTLHRRHSYPSGARVVASLFIFLFVMLRGSGALGAETPTEKTWMDIGVSHDDQALGTWLDFAIDRSGNLSIDQVLAPHSPLVFQRNTRHSLNFGYLEGRPWVRLVLYNSSSLPRTAFIENRYAQTDYLTIFRPDARGQYQSVTLGDRVPFDLREVDFRFVTFKVTLQPGEKQTVYFTASNHPGVDFPLFLFTEDTFHRHMIVDYAVIGLLFGFSLVMLFYNLFLFVNLRSVEYIFYILYIFVSILLQLAIQGVGQQFLQPHATDSWISNQAMINSVDLCVFFDVFFVIHFLELKTRLPRFSRLLKILAFMALASSLLSYVLSYNISSKITNINGGLNTVLLLTAGVLTLLQGFRSALFFIGAWTIFLISTLLFALKVKGYELVEFSPVMAVFVGQALEITLLSLGIGDKIRAIRKASHEKIKVLNESLAVHVKSLDSKVEEKTRDLGLMLKSIRQGIFTIKLNENQDIIIDKDYSDHLESILEATEIADQLFLRVVLNGTSLTADQKSVVMNVIAASIQSDLISFNLNSDNLPSELHKTYSGDVVKILEIDWVPVLAPGSTTIISFLVTLRDVTAMKNLQLENANHSREMLIVTEIFKIPQDKFNVYVRTCEDFLRHNLRELHAAVETDRTYPKKLFLGLHTMKGIARTYGLSLITAAFHQAEQYCASLQKQEHSGWHKEKIAQNLIEISETVKNYGEINRKYRMQLVPSDKLLLERDFFVAKIDELGRMEALAQRAGDLVLYDLIGKTKFELAAIINRPIDTFFQELFRSGQSLARELGKAQPTIEVMGERILLKENGEKILQDVFIHLMRNSIDHGLEPPEERISKGKAPEGKIRLEYAIEEERIVIFYGDDGRGIHLEKLAELARERGEVVSTDHDGKRALAELIFLEGVSTAQKVTDISGRGIGMKAVRELLEEQQGSIEFVFHETRTVDQRFAAFQFRISIPLHLIGHEVSGQARSLPQKLAS